jgi:FkbM family methyltransferase
MLGSTLYQKITNLCNSRVSASKSQVKFPLYKTPGYHHLRRLYHVETVIDVGVGDQGSPFLYSAFPDANFLSIDPLEECKVTVDRYLGISKKNVFFTVALGNFQGSAFIDVREKISQSSILSRIDSKEFSKVVEKREIKIDRLDNILSSYSLKSKVLLKIDAEGYEKSILEGAENILKKCDYVVLELPLIKNYVGGSVFSNLVEILANAGLEAAAILNLASHNVDICFSRENIET